MKIIFAALATTALADCSPPAATTTASEATTATVASTTTAVATEARMADPIPASVTTGGINVIGPPANSQTNSPLIASGQAPNNWYFEAQFRAQLIASDGHIIAEAPARALTDWTTPGLVPFRVQMPFDIAHDQPAILLLQEDMPPDADHPDNRPTKEIRIPVMLSAAR